MTNVLLAFTGFVLVVLVVCEAPQPAPSGDVLLMQVPAPPPTPRSFHIDTVEDHPLVINLESGTVLDTVTGETWVAPTLATADVPRQRRP